MGLGKFARGVVKEGKRVRWPKKDVLIPSIIVVVVISVVVGLLLFAEDLAGKKLIDILSEAFSSMK
jgi:preprotein translocase SecE subunit